MFARKPVRSSSSNLIGAFLYTLYRILSQDSSFILEAELGGRLAIQVAKEVSSQAAALIAIGSCASWGEVPSADPNPTGAVGADSVISGKPIVNLPGCPPNPYNLLAVVLE